MSGELINCNYENWGEAGKEYQVKYQAGIDGAKKANQWTCKKVATVIAYVAMIVFAAAAAMTFGLCFVLGPPAVYKIALTFAFSALATFISLLIWLNLKSEKKKDYPVTDLSSKEAFEMAVDILTKPDINAEKPFTAIKICKGKEYRLKDLVDAKIFSAAIYHEHEKQNVLALEQQKKIRWEADQLAIKNYHGYLAGLSTD